MRGIGIKAITPHSYPVKGPTVYVSLFSLLFPCLEWGSPAGIISSFAGPLVLQAPLPEAADDEDDEVVIRPRRGTRRQASAQPAALAEPDTSEEDPAEEDEDVSSLSFSFSSEAPAFFLFCSGRSIAYSCHTVPYTIYYHR